MTREEEKDKLKSLDVLKVPGKLEVKSALISPRHFAEQCPSYTVITNDLLVIAIHSQSAFPWLPLITDMMQ